MEQEIAAAGRRIREDVDELLAQIAQTQDALKEEREALRAQSDDLRQREQAILSMERAFREQMQKRAALIDAAKEASEKRDAALLKTQVLEEEKTAAEKTLLETEKRLDEALRAAGALENENSRLRLVNRKLTEEKTTLLKMQLQKGGNTNEEKTV